MSELLNVKQVAQHFSVSRQTVRRWMREGRLPYMQVGSTIRIKQESVQQFIEQNEREREAIA